MRVIYSDAHRAHQPAFEVYDGAQVPYAETAARVDSILNELRKDTALEIVGPQHFPRHHIAAIHQGGYIDFVRRYSEQLGANTTQFPSYFMSDTYAPLTAGTYRASIAAVDTALTGANQLLQGEQSVYSLCRPPGHHAAHHTMGGYCYFNNAAIAAHYLSSHGKVAILDIDYHHGNGTQDAFYDRADVAYVSLHASPAENYPYSSGFAGERGRGEGLGFTRNYPLAGNTTDHTYLRMLSEAIAEIAAFAPSYLIVSAGFDTYNLDPIGGLRLTKSIYRTIGQEIAALRLPTLIVQEGGYNVADLGYLVAQFLQPFCYTT